eukprot:gene621-1199_t
MLHRSYLIIVLMYILLMLRAETRSIVNYAFLNHMQNFKCFLDRLGLKRKVEAVYEVLKLGCNVIFMDLDNLLIHDPIQMLIWNNVDCVFSLNKLCGFDESNQKVLKVWQKFFIDADVDKDKKDDDQKLFWSSLRKTDKSSLVFLGNCSHQPLDEHRLITCRPDECETGAGALRNPEEYESLLRAAREKSLNIVAIHANFMRDNHFKMEMMQKYGLWLATRGSEGIGSEHWNGLCKPFNSSKYAAI